MVITSPIRSPGGLSTRGPDPSAFRPHLGAAEFAAARSSWATAPC